MARENGGGGAIGWTLLGFLAGVAATLGVQLLMNGPVRQNEEPSSASSGPVAVVVSSAPQAKKTVVASSAAPAPTTKRAQPEAEVADDAAAAGMTSRTAPIDPDPDVPPDHPAPTPSN